MSFVVDFKSLRIGDIVRTPAGALAIVAARSHSHDPKEGPSISLAFPEDSRGEHNSWWTERDGLRLVCRWTGIKALCNFRAGKREMITTEAEYTGAVMAAKVMRKTQEYQRKRLRARGRSAEYIERYTAQGSACIADLQKEIDAYERAHSRPSSITP